MTPPKKGTLVQTFEKCHVMERGSWDRKKVYFGRRDLAFRPNSLIQVLPVVVPV